MKKYDPDDELTIGEAALEVRVATRTIQRWMKLGLAFKRYGKRTVRILKADLDAYGVRQRKESR
jgi:excisionase family DNA binding protein